MPALDEPLEQTKAYLAERFVSVADEWIREQLASGCEPFEPIYQRWLEQDWCRPEIASHARPTLPSELNLELMNVEKKTFSGKFVLQVKQIIDISKPLPLDGQQVTETSSGTDDENASEDEDENELASLMKGKTNQPVRKQSHFTGPRLLQLCLTDGHQECLGIEYQPVPCLHPQLIGAKVMLTGPFDVYIGVIHLRQNHIRILSDKIFEVNQLDPNLPETPLSIQSNMNPPPQPPEPPSTRPPLSNQSNISRTSDTELDIFQDLGDEDMEPIDIFLSQQ